MRMYSRKMIELFCKGFDWAPEPDLVAIVARKYGPVVEIQAQMQERQGGESHQARQRHPLHEQNVPLHHHVPLP